MREKISLDIYNLFVILQKREIEIILNCTIVENHKCNFTSFRVEGRGKKVKILSSKLIRRIGNYAIEVILISRSRYKDSKFL